VPTWVNAVEQLCHVSATVHQLRGTVQLVVNGIKVPMALQEGADALVTVAPPREELEAGRKARREMEGYRVETTARLVMITLAPWQHEKPAGKVSCAETP